MGFSWTSFLLELVNFVALVWILGRLVYRPLRKGIDARRQALADQERAAQAALEAAEERSRELDARAGELERIGERARREAAEEGAELRARMVEQAREDAAAERERGTRVLAVERREAIEAAQGVAVDKSTALAAHLLMEIGAPAVEEALFDRTVRLLEEQPERLAAGAGADGERFEVEVEVAQMPDEQRLQRLRTCLGEVLGGPPKLVLRENPALGAGLLVRHRGLVLDATLAGRLEAFRAEVARTLAARGVT